MTIIIKNLSISFPHKTCIEDFSSVIYPGERITIIGKNGSGKSSLLKALYDQVKSTMIVGYVPQIVEAYETKSGAQRFQTALTDALSLRPDVLLLDEPTNHLDLDHRKSLRALLEHYEGMLIVVSHDKALMQGTLWHIDLGQVHVFKGEFEDYHRELNVQKQSLEEELSSLNKQKKDVHQALMKEQERASKSDQRGEKKREQRKWQKITAGSKERQAQNATAKNQRMITDRRSDIQDKLSKLPIMEEIRPRFVLPSSFTSASIVIHEGKIGYTEHWILEDINLSIAKNERVAFIGPNGCGNVHW